MNDYYAFSYNLREDLIFIRNQKTIEEQQSSLVPFLLPFPDLAEGARMMKRRWATKAKRSALLVFLLLRSRTSCSAMMKSPLVLQCIAACFVGHCCLFCSFSDSASSCHALLRGITLVHSLKAELSLSCLESNKQQSLYFWSQTTVVLSQIPYFSMTIDLYVVIAPYIVDSAW